MFSQDLDRALVFSTQIDDVNAISELACKFLDDLETFSQSVNLFCKSRDFSKSRLVIDNGLQTESYSELYKYLNEARLYGPPSDLKLIDTNILVVLAFLGNDYELKEFLNQSSNCDANHAGNICLNANLLAPAQILFTSSSNFGKLSLVHSRNRNYQKAIEFADRANDLSIWFEICIECLEQNELQSCIFTASKLLRSNYKVFNYL